MTRVWVGCAAGSLAAQAVVGLLGDSAAAPGLGPRTASPPWDLAAHPPAWLVTALLVAGQLLGVIAVLAGLRALAAGHRPSPRWVGGAAVAAVAVLVMVPPVGSADHLSYVAYGRIAASRDDPYAVPPIDWHGGLDPVAGAVQPPWQRTPSVYGPVATAAQALVAELGHGSLRWTVWCWQVLCGLAFLLVGRLLQGPGRERAAVVWTGNPLLLGQLVLGAHVDVLAVALALPGLLLVRPGRSDGGEPGVPIVRAVAGGALLGAAAGTKAPYGLFALAALWSLRALPARRRPVAVAWVATGALAVVVAGYRWAGPHALDQVRTASRFTSIASPWRALVNLGELVAGRGTLGPVVVPLALVLAAALAVALFRRLSALPAAGAPADRGDGARMAVAMTGAWVLTAPYALPWYDAMVWAPLALVPASALDGLLLARLAVLALAYVPGRTVGLSPPVEALTLGGRRYLAPALVAAVIVATVRWTACGPRQRPPPGARARPGPGRAR
ncbi:MAG TPA: polyprenol phosphomannose-dependent alpha 1,6 mannosyltransferase MptB [Kineosporiaceae bacterium]